MKRFLTVTAAFALLVAATVYGIFYAAINYTDEVAYHKVASPQQTSLILGNSKPAQGIQPAVLHKVLGRDDIYNFAFTIGSSPFGPSYLTLIKKKVIRHPSADGLFVIAVDPWSIGVVCDQPVDSLCFDESRRFTGTTERPYGNPNLSYLKDHYGSMYFRLFAPISDKVQMHPDGWTEIKLKQTEKEYRSRLKQKLTVYQRHARTYVYSPTRVEYLKRTIRFLQDYGQVFLVRLPVDPQVYALEQQNMPYLSDSLRRWSQEEQAPLIDFSEHDTSYGMTDGNHLTPEAGAEISLQLAQFIRDNR